MAMVASVRPKSLFHLTLVVVSVALLLAVAYPLWKPLLIGAVFAATLLPSHDRLSALLKGRPHLAAALMLIGIVLLILLPLAWLVSVAVRESLAGIAFLRQTLETHGPEVLLEHLPDWLAELVRSGLESFSASADELLALAKARGPATAAALGTALGATAQLLVQAVLLMIAFYFLLLDGRRVVRWLAGVTPSPDEALAIASHLARAARSVLSSLFLTALAQSGVATAGYLIARVPHAVFFGLLTFVAAFIPSIGTTIVALPVALLMLALGHPWAALFLALWGLLVVGLIDNVVKPLLIKGGVQLDAAFFFSALVAGGALSGPAGLIPGPPAAALSGAGAPRRARKDRYRGEAAVAPEAPAAGAPH